MSIPFSCSGCQQSLKAPDGSSGKKVRCPACETVNVVPDVPVLATPADVPFPPGRTASVDAENPFAAPQSYSDPQPNYTSGELRQQVVDFGEVVQQSWRRFQPVIGVSLLYALIWMAIIAAHGVVSQTIQATVAAIGDPIVIGVVFVISFFVQQVVGAYQHAMGVRYGLNVSRGQPEVLNGIFSFDSMLRVILLFFLIGLILVPILLLAWGIATGIGMAIDGGQGGPASVIGFVLGFVFGLMAFIFVVLRLFLSAFFVLDRNAGILDAIQQSNAFMTGNGAPVFFILLAMFIGLSFFSLVTCGLGVFIAWPFFQTVQAVIYEKVTGQYQDV